MNETTCDDDDGDEHGDEGDGHGDDEDISKEVSSTGL